MRQDQEPVVGQGLPHLVGYLLRLERGVVAEQLLQQGRLRGDPLEHAGANALRAQRLHDDAAVPVGGREPLGEGDRGVLGDRVRRAAQHGEQAGRRGGDHEPAGAPLEPAGHQLACGAHVAEHVDLERPHPVLGAGVQAAADVDPGVAEPDVHLTQLRACGSDERLRAVLAGRVPRYGETTDRLRDPGGGLAVEVVDHDPGPLSRQPGGDRPADAVPRPGHHDAGAGGDAAGAGGAGGAGLGQLRRLR